MKTWILVILLSITLWGCEKEPIPDPVVEPISKFVTITAKAGIGGVIDPSGSVSVKANSSTKHIYTIKPDSGFILKSVKINNVDQYPVTDKYELSYLSGDRNIEVEFESADYLLITDGKWYLESLCVQFAIYNDTTWVKYNLEPRQYTDYKIYTMDGYVYDYDVNEKVFGGPFKYSISGKILTVVGFGNGPITIAYLDHKKMVQKFGDGNGDKSATYFRFTYTHKKGIYDP